MTGREAELARNLAVVRERIDAARSAAGRSDEVALVVVTKRFPASDVGLLADLGVTDVGENKEQELRAKFDGLGARANLTLHFIGQLQSNKAAAVAQSADVVQSLDRPKLVGALARHRAPEDPLDVLIQVCLDDAPGRGGVAPERLLALADHVAEQPGLSLRGLMAVAPLGAEPGAAFARLARLHTRLQVEHPEAVWLSAGMSGDLEAAIAHGATHLRVGTAILGTRPSLG